MSTTKKKLLRKIRQAAGSIPTFYVKTKIPITGAELLAKHPHVKDRHGEPIDPKETYIVDAQVPKNHQRAMKKEFLKGGIDAVNGYIHEQLEINERAITTQHSMLKGMDERKALYGI